MICKEFPIQVEGSSPKANVKVILIEDSPEYKMKKRPVIILCPGGGYAYLSDREGEILALQYSAMGYQVAILNYSISPAVYPTAVQELAKTVLMLRENAAKWHIDPNKIIVSGSSAGGHLAASYGVFWNKEVCQSVLVGIERKAYLEQSEWANEKLSERELLRPNGMILNYPVITSGEFAHRDSFKNLLGERYEELVDEMSLELQVTDQTPQAFIWHTFEDGLVPVENSLLMVSALRKAGVSVEFHMFPKGGHGIGLANKLTQTPEGNEIFVGPQKWIELVHTWIEEL